MVMVPAGHARWFGPCLVPHLISVDRDGTVHGINHAASWKHDAQLQMPGCLQNWPA